MFYANIHHLAEQFAPAGPWEWPFQHAPGHQGPMPRAVWSQDQGGVRGSLNGYDMSINQNPLGFGVFVQTPEGHPVANAVHGSASEAREWAEQAVKAHQRQQTFPYSLQGVG